MRVIATTVVRESIKGKQRSGYVYDLDWDAGTVTHSFPVPEPSFPESDDNPRGGVRGGRGVAVTREGIVLANYDTLYRYGDDWKLLDEFSHPLFVGMHEIDWDGEHIWMAATGIDALLRATLDQTVDVAWDPLASDLVSRYGLRPRPNPVDGSVDYRKREAPLIDQCHVNGVARHGSTTVVNCGLVRPASSSVGRFERRVRAKLGVQQKKRKAPGSSVVVGLDDSGAMKVLVEMGGHDVPTHNGQALDDDRIAVNDSTGNTLRVCGSDGQELQSLKVDGTWLRGMEPLPDDRVLLGTAPATIVMVDVGKNEIVGRLQLSENPFESVHGLTVCPPPDQRR